MATLQTALRKAGLSASSPEAIQIASDLTQDYSKIETQQPVAVLKRELLWSGGIIEIKIPGVCREGAFEDIRFIQFARFVKGGVVNLFVHDDNPTQHCGKVITASVQVFCKEYADGRTFLYVDLRPMTKPATHRLTVMDAIPGVTSWAPTATVLLTPAPLQGAVVIVGREEKFR